MADVFKKENVIALIKGKHILLIGDSNIRAIYKDLVWLYNKNTLIGRDYLKKRLENSYLGDKLIERSALTRGRDFSEHRIFENKGTKIEFFFVTKCYCKKLINTLNDIKNGVKHCPDVILMNSCLWDISRWGPDGVSDYKANMDRLMKLLLTTLPKSVLFIWATALPISAHTSGGLLIKQIEFLQVMLRIHVVEANAFTSGLVSSYGFDILDFHHYMRYQIIRRSADGVHFLPPAMRYLTNLLLTHISLSWDVKLPGNLISYTFPLASNIEKAIEASKGNEAKLVLRKIEQLADTLKETNSGEKPTNDPCKVKKTQPVNLRKRTSKTTVPKQMQPKTKKPVLKTPPFYLKASSARNRNKSNGKNNHNMQRQSYNNLKNWMNSQDKNINRQKPYDYNSQQNFQNNQSFYVDLPVSQKDFHLLGFNQNSNISISSCNVTMASLQSNYDDHSGYSNGVQSYSVSHSYKEQQFRAGLELIRLSTAIINKHLLEIAHLYNVNNNQVTPNVYTYNATNNRDVLNEDRFYNYQNHPYKSEPQRCQQSRNGGRTFPNIGPIRHGRRATRYNCGLRRY